MPKAEPHFDAPALIREVHNQDIGLRVSTNSPDNFRQIIYKASRRIGVSVHIYADPASRYSFFLLKQELPQEQPHAQSQSG